MGMQDGMDEADPLSLVVIAYIAVAALARRTFCEAKAS